MRDVVICAERLSKTYRIGRQLPRYRTLRDSITSLTLAPFRKLNHSLTGRSTIYDRETLWALKDVSFEIKRGEIVGIVGRNGAGKSTLLKLLSSITEPTAGRAEICGRVGTLLEVGTGFHQELTGRENIYMNGAILGMKRAEIKSKFDEIVAFSEVEKFIDTPVKYYSSGMYMRLAFAVAAHLETEILLVDEVLAIGDIKFQQKCIQKMGEVTESGQTVLLVSHNLRLIESLAKYCIYLKSGNLSNIGDTKQIVKEYQKDALTILKSSELSSEFDINIDNPVVNIHDFLLLDPENNKEITSFGPGKSVVLSCSIESREILENAVICTRIYKDRIVIAGNNSNHTIGNLKITNNEKYKLQIKIDCLWLVPGNYSVVVFVLPDYFSSISKSLSHFSVKDFVVQGSRSYGGGYITFKQDWVFEKENI